MSLNTNLPLAKSASIEEVLGDIKDPVKSRSSAAAEILCQNARAADMNIRDYLRYSINVNKGEFSKEVNPLVLKESTGYELALMYLGLPTRNDIDNGVLLRAADEAFNTQTGARALFPYVTDDIVQWKYRFINISTIEQLVSQSRTISGSNELVTTTVDDEEDSYLTASISEGGRIPIQRILTSDVAVKFFKHGMGYEYTKEFERRASIDLLIPYLARAQRIMERSKVRACTSLIINGDGVHGASPVYTQAGDAGIATLGLQYRGLVKFLADKAVAGIQLDTLMGSIDSYLKYLFLFAPVLNAGARGGDPKDLEAVGGPAMTPNVPGIFFPVKFVVSDSVPANTIVAFNKAETAEELKEAGSEIEESEQAIRTQTTTVVRTNNSGYRLIFGDTRCSYTWNET